MQLKLFRNAELLTDKPQVNVLHPAGIPVDSDECYKPVNSASHCRQLGHLFKTSGHTISCEKSTNITSIFGLIPKITI